MRARTGHVGNESGVTIRASTRHELRSNSSIRCGPSATSRPDSVSRPDAGSRSNAPQQEDFACCSAGECEMTLAQVVNLYFKLSRMGCRNSRV